MDAVASSVERFSTEIRHLQRTELLEVEEYFEKNQKGSSAMPHKRNPILSENLTGISRYIRSSVIPSMENISLWHERDISHSSVERIIAPDATIAMDFALSRLSNLIKNLIVYPKNMKKNIDKLGGLHKSQNILLALTQKRLSRQEAYLIIQSAAMKSWNSNKQFKDILQKDKKIKKYLNKNDLNKLFNSKDTVTHIDKIFQEAFKK